MVIREYIRCLLEDSSAKLGSAQDLIKKIRKYENKSYFDELINLYLGGDFSLEELKQKAEGSTSYLYLLHNIFDKLKRYEKTYSNVQNKINQILKNNNKKEILSFLDKFSRQIHIDGTLELIAAIKHNQLPDNIRDTQQLFHLLIGFEKQFQKYKQLSKKHPPEGKGEFGEYLFPYEPLNDDDTSMFRKGIPPEPSEYGELELGSAIVAHVNDGDIIDPSYIKTLKKNLNQGNYENFLAPPVDEWIYRGLFDISKESLQKILGKNPKKNEDIIRVDKKIKGEQASWSTNPNIALDFSVGKEVYFTSPVKKEERYNVILVADTSENQNYLLFNPNNPKSLYSMDGTKEFRKEKEVLQIAPVRLAYVIYSDSKEGIKRMLDKLESGEF